MTEAHSPALSRRRVLAELRAAREALRLSRKEVAEAMDWSFSKLTRIENGTVGLSITDLKALLLHYGITDRDRVETYVAMAKAGREPGWWSQYKDFSSPEFLKFISLESAAVAVRQYQLHLIPGLLQTPEYTRSLVATAHADQVVRERVVRLRADRQRRVIDPEFEQCYILDESLLHRRITDVENWRSQLNHLREVSQQLHVSIRILPYQAGWVDGMQSSFLLLQLSDQPDDLFLNLSRPDGDQFFDDLDGAEKAVQFMQIFDRLQRAALAAKETPEFIDGVLRQSTDM